MSDMGILGLVAFFIGCGTVLFMVCYSIDMMASVAQEAMRTRIRLEELRKAKHD